MVIDPYHLAGFMMPKSFRVPALVAGCLLAFGAQAPAASVKKTIQQLSSIFENSTPVFQYTFVANIGDQRGYTFGFVGFTSGTYSGTFFLEEYQRLNPGNALVRFLPAFRRIDAGPHDSEGRNPSTEGLEEFPAAFQSCGGDPAFRRAQIRLVNRLIWNPAMAVARKLRVRYPLTQGQIYDAYVNHGEDGINRLLAKAKRRAGGTPATGVSEKKWLDAFLAVRLAVLRKDSTWVHAVDRIAVYQRLLRDRNYRLRRPIEVDCYGNHFRLD
jgi:chitosanase